MKKRLRQAYSSGDLRFVYTEPHQHHHWVDHRVRVQATIALCKFFPNIYSVADLSCGDATIAKAVDAPITILGDYARGYQITGPIEHTIDDIPNVDLFICSETLEHLNEPEMVLSKIRAKAKHLVLTTPDGCWDDDNPEHYWAWDADEIRGMLVAAGFRPVLFQSLQFLDKDKFPYNYQMWGCE